jgi:hypothetical protein
MGTVSFLGAKLQGSGFKFLPHLAPRIKKEYKYASSSPLLKSVKFNFSTLPKNS